MISAIRNISVLSLLLSFTAYAQDSFNTLVDIEFVSSVFYTTVTINGISDEFMIDTGAGKTLIDREMYRTLYELGDLHAVRNINVRQADGTVMKGKLYKVKVMDIGRCRVKDAFVLHIPAVDMNLLGLNTLELLSPVVLDSSGSHLLLSNCESISTVPP